MFFKQLKNGIYKAEHNNSIFDKYRIVVNVRETEKSFIFELLEFDSVYSPAPMEEFFRKSKRVVLRKNKGGHAIRIWNYKNFTLYPFQAGIPFYFRLAEGYNVMEGEKV